METDRTRILDISGKTVVFAIEISNAVASVGEGRTIPEPRSHLGATEFLDGRETWSGVLKYDVPYPAKVADHFKDDELVRLYEERRAGGKLS